MLGRAGFTGWRGNVRVRVMGEWYVADVVFGVEKVAIEVDSWQYHGGRTSCERDRVWHNRPEAAGWIVLHVTPDMLDDNPREFIRCLRRVLEQRGRV